MHLKHTVDALASLLPSIRYGTQRYPENVARRLAVLNIATWIMAANLAFFTVVRLFDPVPGRLLVSAVTAVFTVVFATIPMLHGFGPWIATHAFVVVFLSFSWRVTNLVGTQGGQSYALLVLAGLATLLYGRERLNVAVGVAVVAVANIIAQQLILPPDTGFLPLEVLLKVNFPLNVICSVAALFAMVYYAVQQVVRAEAATAREYARSESLLTNILPASVAARLKDAPRSEVADAFPNASILFADMAGYTAWASDVSPTELVRSLNVVYTRFDSIVERYGLEKIKTSGDSYMVVSGVPVARPDHAAAIALFALEMRDAVSKLTDPRGRPIQIRIGIASGPVVAGIVGFRKYSYDVWGDAVNTASRMESTGKVGQIQVAPATYEVLKHKFEFAVREAIEVRGKGMMQPWFLIGSKPDSTDA